MTNLFSICLNNYVVVHCGHFLGEYLGEYKCNSHSLFLLLQYMNKIHAIAEEDEQGRMWVVFP